MAHCTRERAATGGSRRLLAPRLLLALAVPAALAPLPAAAAPRVVVTVKPLHSLVAGVMGEAGEPELIIRGSGSPHTYNLKPSEARRLAGAQVVFWVGEPLETFMGKPLAALGSKARVVEVLRAPGIALRSGRAGGAWDEPAGEGAAGREAVADDTHGHAGEHGAAALDGHLWLDPANARAIARLAAVVLGEVDPANRARYAGNADRLVARIDALDAELAATLAPVRDVPFVVFHDAYQYFEKRYGLRAVGSIAVGPGRTAGARRVREIRERIRLLGARCVFGEPQFPAGLLGTLTEGTAARIGTLDPLGAGLAAGPEAYFTLMRDLGSSLASCLRGR